MSCTKTTTFSTLHAFPWSFLIWHREGNQSTLRQPEVHILYIEFNVTRSFVWEIMICTPRGEPQKKTKGYIFWQSCVLAFSKVSIASVTL